jgi:hypothetical protein
MAKKVIKEVTQKTKSWLDNTSKGLKILLIVIVVISAAVVYGLYDKGTFDNILNSDTSPTIEYASPDGKVYSNKLINSISELRVVTNDPNGDELTVSFWLSNLTSSWQGISSLVGGNGTYICKLPRTYSLTELEHDGYKWRVDVYDGESIITRTYDMWEV